MILLLVSGIAYGVVAVARVLIEAGGELPERGGGWARQLYIVWLQMTDPGNMAQDIESSPFLKLPAVMAGVLGIVVLSALIALITTALIERMESLRKGHSRVIEEEHTLIIGWEPQRVSEIIRELSVAKESEDNPSVVILADEPKVEMDDYLGLVLPDTLNTRIITRSGSTSSIHNIHVVSAETCKAVIVLASASEESSRDQKNQSDAQTIKTILALSSACPPEENELNIVAEIFERDHYKIVQANCPHRIEIIDANEILAKILVQTSRSVGLSVAYSEILSFDGCEMYFYGADWNGVTFGAGQFHYPDGATLGIRKADGEILINPAVDRVLEEGDEVLILAQDDSTIRFESAPVTTPKEIPLKPGRVEQGVENELIIGWNRKGRIIVEEYSEYVKDGSSVDIILEHPTDDSRAEIQELNDRLGNLTVRLMEKDPLLEKTLLEANPASRDNIILLSGGENVDAEKADARTILILLLIRKALSEHPDETVDTRLITEVMDSANRSLIAETGVKDFIISNRFISMLLAQMSEELDIKEVYDQLFAEDGSEIYLKPASLYFQETPVEVTYADCMRIAQKRGEVCLGVKLKAEESNEDANFGVRLVPDKNTRYHLTARDCLIVLAEDEA